jgi:hypothetical protein
VALTKNRSLFTSIRARTARKAIELLEALDVLRETTGLQRDCIYGNDEYMQVPQER